MIVIIFLTHLFSVLRLPFALIPYLVKLTLIYCFGDAFSEFWNKYSVQIIRILGDFANFLITTFLFYKFHELMVSLLPKILLDLIVISEFIRLLTEKGVMILSALWQAIPHSSLAKSLHDKPFSGSLKRYVNYYILSDEKRLEKVLRRLKASARLLNKTQTISKLRYVNSFQIVPDSVNLRAGEVRHVARGEVYVHASWTNNPDILRGQALRRSPWIFDPRYLRRPFYYRTEANYLMTLFVFENARLCPFFAVYQFGHEIKSARYNIFYRLLRWLGFELEQPVCENSTNSFDTLAKTIMQNRLKTENCRPLWTDDEVMADMTGKPISSAMEIAEKYTYPLIYVQEVLINKIAKRQDGE